jgi:trehalose/maltose hydrolase-like predicted phosphorylase
MMLKALEPTQEPGWVLSHDGYNVLTESAVESRFAFGNGFLGMRAARSVSRGPTWVGWLGYSRWASWPRCYVAGLFDVPNIEPPVPALVPVADWSRVRVLLDGEPLLAREGEIRVGSRKLDLRRGVLLSAWTHRTPPVSPSRGTSCASSHWRTARRACNSWGSRWTATTST